MYYLPQIDITDRQEWNEESLSPHSAHAQFTRHFLLQKIVFQYPKQEEVIRGRQDSVSVDFAVNRDFNVRPEPKFDVFRSVVPWCLQ